MDADDTLHAGIPALKKFIIIQKINVKKNVPGVIKTEGLK